MPWNSQPRANNFVATFPTSLHFKGSEEFQGHLTSKAKEIKAKLQVIFTRLAASRGEQSPDIEDLQSKLTKLLAAQKEFVIKLDRLRAERDELNERLETASLRYIKAEKKYDRARSTAVAKLEQQAINGSGNGAGSHMDNGDVEMTNGIVEASEASQTAYKETLAVVEKQKEQMDAINAENKSLTEQLTAATTRLSSLTEDDYARTELFKQFRSQHEDVIRRINHLEATNIQLREDAEKYQAERTAYRVQVEGESEIMVGELEGHIQKVETDLTRIRAARDELLAEQSILKSNQDHDRPSANHFNELLSGKDGIIAALESEIERLKASINEQSCELTPRPEIDSLDWDALRRKYESLERQFEAINKELPAMQSAYTRVQALSTKKVIDLSVLEEKVQVLSAEKAKADQKYFAARKDMDTRLMEVRVLKTQNAKSSEIITQLKDVETANRSLLGNLEKQLSDMKQTNISTMAENKKMEAASREATSKAEALGKQVTELTNLLKAKDANNLNTKQRIQTVELDLEKLQVKFEQVQKERDQWKNKSLSNQSGEEEMLRVGLLTSFARALLTLSRLLLFARFAARISRTRQSGTVATRSATTVLLIVLRIGCANVPIAPIRSTSRMSWRSIFELPRTLATVRIGYGNSDAFKWDKQVLYDCMKRDRVWLDVLHSSEKRPSSFPLYITFFFLHHTAEVLAVHDNWMQDSARCTLGKSRARVKQEA